MTHSIFGRAIAVAILFAGAQIQAATFTVTSMADSGPGTLRDAIIRANATAPASHRIEFATSGAIVLASELPNITVNLEIDGGSRIINITGNSMFPLMRVTGDVTLTLRRLQLSKAVRYAVRSNRPVYLLDSSIQAVDGTGIYVAGAPATVERSSFHNIVGTAVMASEIVVSNSTFTRNTAVEDFPNFKFGSVIYIDIPSRTTRITNVTISDSTLTPGTAVIAGNGGSWLSFEQLFSNTIISNTAGGSNCRLPAVPPSYGTHFYDRGGNLSSDASCGLGLPTSIVGVDAMLGPLSDNGGPTLTMQPLPGSPAINGGVATTSTTDQRGYPRLAGAFVDKGAVEVAGALGLRGFFFPIRNWPIINDTFAGRLVPVRFGFNGYQGMAILAQGFPQSTPSSCTAGPFSPVAEYAQTGGGGLTYDTKTRSYQYVLATQASWKGTCRRLMFRFTDGSSIDAHFRFL